ncbi:extracellular solute-binding protein [Paenibacillus agaridevorans]|uniref:extracellular solute-binding protein n=1 Tax=Paenibacillus agaridevorans TaxID=171404 RepID=UPI001BE434A2|nr:extracellular solute-binding protein [Paenibacillus agaridevorans]
MRLMRNTRYLVLAIAILAVAIFIGYRFFSSDSSYPTVERSVLDAMMQQPEASPNYFTYQKTYTGRTFQKTAPLSVIEAAAYTAKEKGAPIETVPSIVEGRQALQWSDGTGWVEWEVDIPADQLYTMVITYEPLEGSYAGIVRGIQIDGAYPFVEAERIVLPRNWKDVAYPYKRDEFGNELRPVQNELRSLMTETVSDYSVSSEPLVWHLTAGKHKIRMIGQREPVMLDAIALLPYKPIPSYAEYLQTFGELPTNGESERWYQVYEAEGYARKSAPGIQTATYSEPHISPDPKGRTIYNVLGGERWKKAGDWVEWDVEVPRNGFYELELKYLQSMQSSNSYHTLTIDGEAPFREMLAYRKATNSHFELHAMQTPDGEAYRFYLTEGKHTLRLTADASAVTPAEYALRNMLQELSVLDADIRRITGNYSEAGMSNDDLNRTWELKRYYPEIDGKLTSLIDQAETISAYVNGLSGRQASVSSALKLALDSFREMLEDVNEIPNRLKELSRIRSSLSTWITQMTEQKMMLDYIVVRTPGADTGLRESSLLSRAAYMGTNFFRTFYVDYNRKSISKDKAITVWVGRGRDYADILQEMIQQQFTPMTGIPVNVNLMPNPNALILGNAAGNQPDVALGVATETAIEYAMRGAIADLSRMDGFDSVMSRFHPGVMRAHQYDGGTYSLPELQNIKFMFYRTDIFEQLGLEVPDTWEDVFRIMPTLLEKGMTFFYPPGEFAMIFYQNGAEFYDQTGMENLLADPNSVNAFKQWTDMFVKHSLPREVPAFFEHFRLGDLPIGLGDLSTYVQLTVAAPDIIGHWAVAPIPGVRQADGTVARWHAQESFSGIIMKNSKKYEEAWEFLDWWTSAEVQAEFGNNMESINGLEYRWNTANMEAVGSLPWTGQEQEVLNEQARWIKNVPFVPGHYFLGRELVFAWNRTVLGGIPFMESLEKARTSLQREMWRKQKDLGMPADTDLNIPFYERPFALQDEGERHESNQNGGEDRQ